MNRTSFTVFWLLSSVVGTDQDDQNEFHGVLVVLRCCGEQTRMTRTDERGQA